MEHEINDFWFRRKSGVIIASSLLRSTRDFLNLLFQMFPYERNYFWFPRKSGVLIASNLLRSTRDFLNLSFHMFPYNEFLEVFKNKI